MVKMAGNDKIIAVAPFSICFEIAHTLIKIIPQYLLALALGIAAAVISNREFNKRK